MAAKRSRAARRASKQKDLRQALSAVDRGLVRADQKAQGAFDGRFREKVVKSKKRYSRKDRPAPDLD